MHLGVHPAPGFGDLLPGFFVVPQNPLRDGGTPLKPTVTARAGGAVVKVPHIGELMPGKFAVPQNPLRQALSSPPGSGVPGTHGLGCSSCGLGQTSTGGGLMGSLAGAESWFTQSSSILGFSLPNYAWIGLGVVGYMLIAPGGSEYQAVRSRSRGYRRLAARLS